jgi:tRNA(fMet)-specific endonuclease VapC
MVVLDTDHMSVLERNTQPGAATLRAHLANLLPDEVVTTIISYEEQMRGWMAYLAQSRSVAQQGVAYGRLLQHLTTIDGFPSWRSMRLRHWSFSGFVALACASGRWT